MRILILLSTIFLFLSCSSTSDQPPPSIPLNFNPDINPRDTCLRILTAYALEDSFTYQRHYDERTFHDGRISYVKTGALIYPDKKSGIIIYTHSDSTIAVEHYLLDRNKWRLTDKRTDLVINGLIFYAVYQDYNFDGVKDIYVNTAVSNGNGHSMGHLLTMTPDGHLVTHPETIGIRDMEPDSLKKVVKAKAPLGCLTYKAICDLTYKWIDNKLTLVTKPCKCKD